MKRSSLVATPILAAAAVLLMTTAMAGTETEDSPQLALEVDTWQLLKGSGAELYSELCSSCHGPEGSGRELIVEGRRLTGPALTHLKANGVPEQHWVYVIESACDDAHHEIMPCWRAAFREALGSAGLTHMVSLKLRDHLATIQQ